MAACVPELEASKLCACGDRQVREGNGEPRFLKRLPQLAGAGPDGASVRCFGEALFEILKLFFDRALLSSQAANTGDG